MPRSLPREPLAGMETESLVTRGRPSLVGLASSREKLNGQVYTPLSVAARMLEMVRWPLGDDGVLLDPSCGDGVFLQAAMTKVMSLGLSSREERAIIEERLVGWDLDPAALSACEVRLQSFLGGRGMRDVSLRLEKRNTLVANREECFSCVAGNPPYLESKRMPDELKRLVKATCPLAARGAFDLYAAFIERSLALASGEQAEICLIIPNRFLVVSYAEGLRKRLLSTRDVRVVDLSESKVFEDAAVYPVVLHVLPVEPATEEWSSETKAGRARKTSGMSSSSRSYTVLRGESTSEAVQLPSSILLDHLSGTMPVAPAHPGGRSLLARVLQDEKLFPLASRLDVRWTVSFHRAGLRDGFVFSERPRDLLHPMPFLGGGRFHGNRELAAFRIDWGGAWIDYDEERAREEGNSFPPGRIFEAPKLVIAQNARRARVAIDREGMVLKDTFLAGIPAGSAGSEALLEWLAIVLNSDLMHYLYEHLYGGTRKNGGYLHYLPRYLGPLPVPEVPESGEVSRLHEALAKGVEEDALQAARAEAEELVASAYELSKQERSALLTYPMPKHPGIS